MIWLSPDDKNGLLALVDIIFQFRCTNSFDCTSREFSPHFSHELDLMS